MRVAARGVTEISVARQGNVWLPLVIRLWVSRGSSPFRISTLVIAM